MEKLTSFVNASLGPCQEHLSHYNSIRGGEYAGVTTFVEVNHSMEALRETMEAVCGQSRFRIGVQAASLLLIILTSLFSNLLVFYVFYHRPALLTISNRFVLNLAICNFCVTTTLMPFAFIATIMGPSWRVNTVGCQVVAVTTTLLFVACIFTLLLISVDRLYAIQHPLHYTMTITRFRASLFISLVWLLSLIVAILPFFGAGEITYQPAKALCTTHWPSRDPAHLMYTFGVVTLCFLLPFVLMAWIYVKIFRAVQKTSALARRNSALRDLSDLMATQTMLAQSAQPSPRRKSSLVSLTLYQIGSIARRQSVSGMSRASIHREDWRAAKTALIVMSTFTFCWLPLFIVITLEATIPLGKGDLSDLPVPRPVQTLSVWLALLACSVNPLVYVIRTKAFKMELWALLGRPPPPADNAIILRDPLTTGNGRLTKTASTTTFSRFLTPRPSSVSYNEVEETKAALSGGLMMKPIPCNNNSLMP